MPSSRLVSSLLSLQILTSKMQGNGLDANAGEVGEDLDALFKMTSTYLISSPPTHQLTVIKSTFAFFPSSSSSSLPSLKSMCHKAAPSSDSPSMVEK